MGQALKHIGAPPKQKPEDITYSDLFDAMIDKITPEAKMRHRYAFFVGSDFKQHIEKELGKITIYRGYKVFHIPESLMASDKISFE